MLPIENHIPFWIQQPHNHWDNTMFGLS